jgi:hypothetical protein
MFATAFYEKDTFPLDPKYYVDPTIGSIYFNITKRWGEG